MYHPSTTLYSASGINKSYSSIRGRFVHYLDNSNWPIIRWTILAFLAINLTYRFGELISDENPKSNELIDKLTIGLIGLHLIFLTCAVNPLILDFILWTSLPALGWHGYILVIDFQTYNNQLINRQPISSLILANPFHYFLRRSFKVYLFLITSLYCEEYLNLYYSESGIFNAIKSVISSIVTNCCTTVDSKERRRRKTYGSFSYRPRRRTR